MFRNLHIAVISLYENHAGNLKVSCYLTRILALSTLVSPLFFQGEGLVLQALSLSLGFVIFGKGTIELSFQLFGKMELCNEQLNNHVIFSREDKKASLITIDLMFGIEEDLLISIFLQTLYTSSLAKSVRLKFHTGFSYTICLYAIPGVHLAASAGPIFAK